MNYTYNIINLIINKFLRKNKRFICNSEKIMFLKEIYRKHKIILKNVLILQNKLNNNKAK